MNVVRSFCAIVMGGSFDDGKNVHTYLVILLTMMRYELYLSMLVIVS